MDGAWIMRTINYHRIERSELYALTARFVNADRSSDFLQVRKDAIQKAGGLNDRHKAERWKTIHLAQVAALNLNAMNKPQPAGAMETGDEFGKILLGHAMKGHMPLLDMSENEGNISCPVSVRAPEPANAIKPAPAKQLSLF